MQGKNILKYTFIAKQEGITITLCPIFLRVGLFFACRKYFTKVTEYIYSNFVLSNKGKQ